jgi:hypothetical protein
MLEMKSLFVDDYLAQWPDVVDSNKFGLLL